MSEDIKCVICLVKPAMAMSEFCGHDCFLASKRITYPCSVCAKIITNLKCFNHKTCSKACEAKINYVSSKGKSELTKLPCAFCGVEFQIRKKRLEKGENKFCTVKCASEFKKAFICCGENQHPDKFIFNKAGEQHFYSSWEFRRMKEIDFDKSVLSWKKCERKISWIDSRGKECSYQPDFEIVYMDGTIVIEEVKGFMNDDEKRKIDAGRSYAECNGLIYRVISSIEQFTTVKPVNERESYDNDYGVFYRPTLEYVFMLLAHQLSERSTCLRNHVGVVITDKEMTQAFCLGYNGSEVGGSNQCDSLEQGKCNCVHAEINAMAKSTDDIRGCVVFSTVAPCVVCAKVLINRGISKVIYLRSYHSTDGLRLLRNSGIEVCSYSDFCLFSDKKISEYLLKD